MTSFARSEPMQSVFCMCGMLMGKVYSNNLSTDDTKESIQNVVFSVLSAELSCAMNGVFVRLMYVCELRETICNTFEYRAYKI